MIAAFRIKLPGSMPVPSPSRNTTSAMSRPGPGSTWSRLGLAIAFIGWVSQRLPSSMTSDASTWPSRKTESFAQREWARAKPRSNRGSTGSPRSGFRTSLSLNARDQNLLCSRAGPASSPAEGEVNVGNDHKCERKQENPQDHGSIPSTHYPAAAAISGRPLELRQYRGFHAGLIFPDLSHA